MRQGYLPCNKYLNWNEINNFLYNEVQKLKSSLILEAYV